LPADSTDTSCSADLPPNSNPTRNRVVIRQSPALRGLGLFDRLRTECRERSADEPMFPQNVIRGRRIRAPTIREAIMLGTVLLVILILLLVGAIPSWPHSRSWGYGPSGILGIVLIVVLVLALTGRV
jgi:hypothetical protein